MRVSELGLNHVLMLVRVQNLSPDPIGAYCKIELREKMAWNMKLNEIFFQETANCQMAILFTTRCVDAVSSNLVRVEYVIYITYKWNTWE